jgi:hypothetical protein
VGGRGFENAPLQKHKRCAAFTYKDSVLINRLTLILAFLTITVTVWSQVTVTGTVVAKEDNSPLPQVNVVEKGTRNRTTTNSDGTFSLSITGPNSILVFSFIGRITQERLPKGKQRLFIEMKPDCFIDFFDSHKIIIYANSGVINNPLGGQIEIASPDIYHGVVKGMFAYQTNLNKDKFQNGQFELSHYISNCDFDIDFRLNYRQVSFDDNFDSRAYSFETDLNVRNIKLIAGYSHLDFDRIETIDKETLSGVLIGVGSSELNIPLYPTVMGKVSLYRNKIEYQAAIQGGYQWFHCFIKFYKLNSFSELSLGIGTSISYRPKRRRR